LVVAADCVIPSAAAMVLALAVIGLVMTAVASLTATLALGALRQLTVHSLMIAGPGRSRLKRPLRASALPVGDKSSASAVAEDVLDSQPVEPTAMEDQPGQQTV